MNFIEIDIKEYTGSIPKNSELIIAEQGNVKKTAMVLYGFDEVELFKKRFDNPVYGFLSNEQRCSVCIL